MLRADFDENRFAQIIDRGGRRRVTVHLGVAM